MFCEHIHEIRTGLPAGALSGGNESSFDIGLEPHRASRRESSAAPNLSTDAVTLHLLSSRPLAGEISPQQPTINVTSRSTCDARMTQPCAHLLHVQLLQISYPFSLELFASATATPRMPAHLHAGAATFCTRVHTIACHGNARVKHRPPPGCFLPAAAVPVLLACTLAAPCSALPPPGHPAAANACEH